MGKMIDDDILYEYMPQVEKDILEKIPPESGLSHKFSWTFRRKMKALLKYQARTPKMRRFVRQIKTSVAILLLSLSIVLGTIMSVEAYRIRFFRFVIKVWKDRTSISIDSDESSGHDTIMPISPSYIPEGYSILEQINNEYKNSIIYSDESGTEIYYLQKLSSQSEYIFDSEGAVSKEISIGTRRAYMIANKGVTQLFWYDNFNTYSLIGSLDENEIIKMAESIIK